MQEIQNASNERNETNEDSFLEHFKYETIEVIIMSIYLIAWN